jgi:hypothetical protein
MLAITMNEENQLVLRENAPLYDAGELNTREMRLMKIEK